MQSPKSGESDSPKPIESSLKLASQSSRDSLKAIDSSALHRKDLDQSLGASRPYRRPPRRRVPRSVRPRCSPRSHPRLDRTCLNAIAAAEFPLIVVGHEPWLTQLAGILTIGRAESLFRLKKGGLIWLQGEAKAAGMLTKIVLAPAPTLNLLDTQG